MDLYLKGITIALGGVPTTVGVSLFAVAFGLLLGMALAFMKRSKNKIIYGIANLYVEIVRGTPLLVQVLIFAYGLPKVFDFTWAELVIPCMLVCALNSGAYMAEVIRGGINAVGKDQMEAALSLGMTQKQSMRHIIMPQAIKICIPSLGNEFITLIKETSILSYVGTVEILRKATLWNASSFNTFEAYIGAAIVYLMLTIPLSMWVKKLEKKFAKGGAA